MDHAYSDILNAHRPTHDADLFSRRHPKMTRLNRAKIFAPFAALAGFENAVRSKEIQYVPRRIPDPEEVFELNRTLNELYLATRTGELARLNRITAKAVYFVACGDINNDAYGRQGLYHTAVGTVWKVDPACQTIQIGDKVISFDAISALKIVRRSL